MFFFLVGIFLGKVVGYFIVMGWVVICFVESV